MAAAVIGRPSIFDPLIFQEIMGRLEKGEALMAICDSDRDRYPHESTVRNWCAKEPALYTDYTRARDLGLDARAERIMRLVDQVDSMQDVPAARLKFDAERWYLSKMAPKRYGDAILQKHADAEGNVLRVEVTRVQGRDDASLPAAQRILSIEATPASDDAG